MLRKLPSEYADAVVSADEQPLQDEGVDQAPATRN
jgi:hypothetical protein